MNSNHFLNFILVASGKIFSLGALFVTNIFVARLTGPVEFGYYSTSLALIILYDALFGAPLDNAVVRFSSFHKKHPEKVIRIQGDIFWLKVVFSLFLLIVCSFYLDVISSFIYGNEDQQDLLLITLLSGSVLVMMRSSACYMQVDLMFKNYANIDILQGAFRLGFVLVFFWLGVSTSLAYLTIYGLSALFVFVFYQFKIKQYFVFSTHSSSSDRKTMLSYIGVTSSIIILGTISGRMDIPILSSLGSAYETGIYSVAAQLAMIGTLLASYMAIIFQPKLIEIAEHGRLINLIFKNILAALFLSLLAIPITIWLLPLIVPLLFGSQYVESVYILQILVIGICFDLLIMPILMPFSIQALPKIIFLGEVVVTVVFFVAAFFVIKVDAVSMAWLVTIIRIMKFLIYFSAVMRFLINNNNYSHGFSIFKKIRS